MIELDIHDILGLVSSIVSCSVKLYVLCYVII